VRERVGLQAALASAAEALARQRVRFEVFARAGESRLFEREAGRDWQLRRAREVGVACRVSDARSAGFAAASGSEARAGREAALAALAARVPGPDPLPSRALLGVTPVPDPEPVAGADEQEAFGRSLAARLARVRPRLALVQARVLVGGAHSVLATGDGFVAHTRASGAVVEVMVAPPDGPWRLFHFAARALAELEPRLLVERVSEAALLVMRGAMPERQLADVVLAPAVAAPLLAALGQHLARPSGTLAGARTAPAWQLVDERAGPDGLMPQPCDGEGFPARRILLVGERRVQERLASWVEARDGQGAAGGSVRHSYRHAPAAAPANLVFLPERPLPQRELLARLGDGFYLVLPSGPARVDHGSGSFVVRAAAVAIRGGRPARAHPIVELRGSLRRLLGGLLAAGGDSEGFSLACAVTTPSLLVRRLEIA
jgi:predicted Zn-dependent protease